jgi:hypothetical protein
MAQLSPADQEKLNKLITEGKKLAKQLGDELSAASLDNINNDLNTAERLVQGLRDEWKEYTNDVSGTREGFTRIVNEIKNMNSGTKAARSSFSGLASLAQKLQSHQEGINKLSSKEIANLKKQAAERTNDLKLAGKLAKDQIKTLEAKNNISNKEKKQLEEARAAHSNITQEITENIGFIKQFEDQLDEAGRKAKNMEGALGLAGNATKAISSSLNALGMGNLVDKLGLDEAQAKMDEMADKITEGGDNAATMGNKFKVMGAGVKSMKSSIISNLKDPLTLVTLVATQLIDALKMTDSGAGDMAKQMNMTYGEALNTRRELGNMAAMSGDVALNTRGLQETYMAVGQSLGTNAKLNEQDLTTMTKLVSQAGFQHDELMEIEKLSLANGKTLEDNTSEILGGAKAYASRRGIVVNEKDVLREVNKMSASLKLSLGGSASAMAEAVVKTKEFGLSLEQASKISESLLNFESSIESELSAELLLGKDLTFEKARQLALNNDIAGAAEEIAKQVGTSADFANMNAIQQEAIAKAAGLTKDELAQSLMDREALSKISAKEGESAQQAFNRLVQEVGLEEAKKQLGDEQLANQFAQQSVQERFAQSMEKLQEIFVNVAGALMPILDIFSEIFGVISSIMSSTVGLAAVLGGLGGLMITKLIPSFSKLGVLMRFARMQGIGAAILAVIKGAWESLGGLPVVGPILAGAAIAGGIALVNSYKADDMISEAPGGGSPGYGKRTLFGPEGAIQLNNKDTVIAGTDLFKKGDDVMSGPSSKGNENLTQPIIVSNKTTPKKEVKQDSNAGTNARLDALIAMTGKVNAVSTLKIQ